MMTEFSEHLRTSSHHPSSWAGAIQRFQCEVQVSLVNEQMVIPDSAEWIMRAGYRTAVLRFFLPEFVGPQDSGDLGASWPLRSLIREARAGHDASARIIAIGRSSTPPQVLPSLLRHSRQMITTAADEKRTSCHVMSCHLLSTL